MGRRALRWCVQRDGVMVDDWRRVSAPRIDWGVDRRGAGDGVRGVSGKEGFADREAESAASLGRVESEMRKAGGAASGGQ